LAYSAAFQSVMVPGLVCGLAGLLALLVLARVCEVYCGGRRKTMRIG
jgi:hypothetical protein